MKSHDEKMKELELCKKTSEAQMWMNELKTLNVKYNDYKTTREKSMSEKAIVKKKKKLNLKK